MYQEFRGRLFLRPSVRARLRISLVLVWKRGLACASLQPASRKKREWARQEVHTLVGGQWEGGNKTMPVRSRAGWPRAAHCVLRGALQYAVRRVGTNHYYIFSCGRPSAPWPSKRRSTRSQCVRPVRSAWKGVGGFSPGRRSCMCYDRRFAVQQGKELSRVKPVKAFLAPAPCCCKAVQLVSR